MKPRRPIALASLAALMLTCMVVGMASAAQTSKRGERLPAFLRSSPEEIKAAAREPNVFASRRLMRVAADFAGRSRRAGVDREPLGAMLLRDLDGRVVALATVFPVGADTPSAGAIREAVASGTAAIVGGPGSEAESAVLPQVATLRQRRRFQTVIVGAAATQRRLLSMRPGLPSQIYLELGRHRVAAAAKAELDQVKLRRSFYEPRLQRGNHEGAVYGVAGKGDHVYFFPSVGSPEGHVVPRNVFMEARQRVTSDAARELAAASGRTGELDDAAMRRWLVERNARQWGRHFAFVDATQGGAAAELCHACTDRVAGLLENGRRERLAWALPREDGADGDCNYIYLNGDRVPVARCEGFSDECCEWQDGEFVDTGDCLSSCECECEGEEWKVIDYPVHLRGVPTLFQHDVVVNPIEIQIAGGTTEACDTTVAVGCGPIAVSEVLIWYDQLGWDEILANYRTAGNEVQWRELAEDLRDDYLGSYCWGEQTATLLGPMEKGFEEFVSDLGLSVSVTRFVIKSRDESVGWSTIRSEINANRPLMLAYNTDGRNGIASGWVDHFGVISGYDDVLGSKIIHVVTGWGEGDNETYEWDIPSNKVHLYSVVMGAGGSGGAEWCSAIGDVNDYFAEDDGDLDFSASKSSYDDWPIQEDLSGTTPPDCDRIGGTIEGFFESHWTERNICLTPFEKKRLDESVLEAKERFESATDPLDQIDPWPW